MSPWREKREIGNATLYLGDCLDILPHLPKVDAVITDPVYPRLDYGWSYVPIEKLGFGECRQFYFWLQPPEPFPLHFTAMHIWSKANVHIGQLELWEAIYEVNGQKIGSVIRDSSINCEMNAQLNGDIYYKHPCQKPIKLMRKLVARTAGVIIDPFMGSGTSGVACMNLGRKFIGIEIEPKYFEIACERIENAQRQQRMFA